MTTTKAISNVILFLLTIAVGYFLMSIVVNKQEQIECYRWREWVRTAPNFYLTDWQKDQCDHHQIEIKVPVEDKEPIEKEEDTYTEMDGIIYAYNSTVEQTDDDPFTMASGNQVYDGAIACPTRIPFGTKVQIKDKMYTCEDRMGEYYRDKNYFDIWMPEVEQAKQWGIKGLRIKIFN